MGKIRQNIARRNVYRAYARVGHFVGDQLVEVLADALGDSLLAMGVHNFRIAKALARYNSWSDSAVDTCGVRVWGGMGAAAERVLGVRAHRREGQCNVSGIATRNSFARARAERVYDLPGGRAGA